MTVTLVAMSGAGDVFFSRDDAGIYRRHHRYLPGDPVEVSKNEVDRVSSVHGFRQVDQEFSSWLELADFAERQVPKTRGKPDDLPVSAALARLLVPKLRGEVSNPESSGGAPRVIGRLLRNEAVRNDNELYRELTGLLEKTEPTPRPLFSVGQGRATQRSRLHRMQSAFESQGIAA